MAKRKTSWKSATGISGAKRKVANYTGIPTTQQGRKKKMERMATGGAAGGCLLYVLAALAIAAIVAILVI